MLFKLLCVVMLGAVVLCNCDEEAEIESYKCFENYLHFNKMMERGIRRQFPGKFKAINATDGCDVHLKNFRDKYYEEAARAIKADEDLSENVDCLIEQMRKFHVAEVSMKLLVYKHSKKLSKRKQKKALRAIDFAIEKKMETAVKLCTTQEEFGKLFDELYSSANQTDDGEEDSPQEDYCMRKYMVDKNFINSTVYKVNLNPLNIDVSGIDCDEIIENSIQESVDELKHEFDDVVKRPSKRTTKCITKTIRSFNFFEANVKVVVLGEVGITDENKIKEKAIYIESMKALYENILKC